LAAFFYFLTVAARRFASLFCFLGGFGEKNRRVRAEKMERVDDGKFR
jgi:hypothetical protein